MRDIVTRHDLMSWQHAKSQANISAGRGKNASIGFDQDAGKTPAATDIAKSVHDDHQKGYVGIRKTHERPNLLGGTDENARPPATAKPPQIVRSHARYASTPTTDAASRSMITARPHPS
ncbi:hypothetical protein GI582_24590 [Sulfitobacter sp. BDSS02]|nr:hypothetical protein [Sulfitobacter sp. BDSS02]MBR9852459.1 hypothetical protein [Paracoccaceae bacterium]